MARLARKPASVDGDGWINHEATLSNVYYREYKKHLKGTDAYNASLDYLAKAGGRPAPRPAGTLLWCWCWCWSRQWALPTCWQAG